MSKQTITFDPTSGVAFGVNLTLNTGATFSNDFSVVTTSGSAFDFTGYSASSQLAKSVAIGSSAHAIKTFNVGFTSAAGGDFNVSLGATNTTGLPEGRYVYDVLVSSGSTTYRIVSGNVLVIAGISSSP
jgi:hypothetical protein